MKYNLKNKNHTVISIGTERKAFDNPKSIHDLKQNKTRKLLTNYNRMELSQPDKKSICL